MISVVNYQGLIDALPCLCWGLLLLVVIIYVIKYLIAPYCARKHELEMKEKAFKQEVYWHEVREKNFDQELNRKIKELEQLTIRQKLLEKVLAQKTDDKLDELGKEFKELKNKFDSLDGEIDKIIIKKKD